MDTFNVVKDLFDAGKGIAPLVKPAIDTVKSIYPILRKQPDQARIHYFYDSLFRPVSGLTIEKLNYMENKKDIKSAVLSHKGRNSSDTHQNQRFLLMLSGLETIDRFCCPYNLDEELRDESLTQAFSYNVSHIHEVNRHYAKAVTSGNPNGFAIFEECRDRCIREHDFTTALAATVNWCEYLINRGQFGLSLNYLIDSLNLVNNSHNYTQYFFDGSKNYSREHTMGDAHLSIARIYMATEQYKLAYVDIYNACIWYKRGILKYCYDFPDRQVWHHGLANMYHILSILCLHKGYHDKAVYYDSVAFMHFCGVGDPLRAEAASRLFDSLRG